MIAISHQLWGIANLIVAGILSALIGLERQYHNKPAGARTLALVGLGAAAFMVVSKYGFLDQSAGVDGSRIAAQVASGVGFLGGGLIFVRRDAVRGLTSAASIWVVAAVGLMAGAGQWIAATAVVGLYHLLNLTLRRATRLLPHAPAGLHTLTVEYRDGVGALRDVCNALVADDLQILDFAARESSEPFGSGARHPEADEALVRVMIKVAGDRVLLQRVGKELLEHRHIRLVDVAETA